MDQHIQLPGDILKQTYVAPDSYSRKLGFFKVTWRGIEGNRRLSGMFPVTFFFSHINILFICLGWTVSPLVSNLYRRNLFGTCHYTLKLTLLMTSV